MLDRRTPDLAGRVPAEDILEYVETGRSVAGSYQHSPEHRSLTTAGWFRLPGELEQALQQRLRARHSS